MTMNAKFKNNALLLFLVLVALPQAWAQDKTTKIKERFNVNDDVNINLDVQNTDIVFEDWNKDEVEIEAYLETDGLSDDEIARLKDNWRMNVQGNSNMIRINSVAQSGGIAFGAMPMGGMDEIIRSSMSIMQPVMKNMVGPLLEGFAGKPLPQEYYKGMSDIKFDYDAYKRDGEKYIKEYNRKVEENFGKDFDDAMKEWGKENSQLMKNWESQMGKNMGLPESPFGTTRNLDFDPDTYGKDKKAYVAKLNKKYGSSASVKDVDKWLVEMEAWGDDLGKGMEREERRLERVKLALARGDAPILEEYLVPVLNLSENFNKVKKNFSNLGITTGKVTLNLSKMMKTKEKSVTVLTKGIEFLFKKNKVTYIKGQASFKSNNEIIVQEKNSQKIYRANHIIISTGSEPTSLPGIKIDEKIIVSSTGALSFNKVPKELVIIGGGYIGLEMGSVWKRLGSNVTVIEFMDHIIPGMDNDISGEFLKILKKQGINFKLDSKVTAVSLVRDKAIVDYINNKTGIREKIKADKVLVAVGRKANTEGLNLAKASVKNDIQGNIQIDKKFQTSVKNIYAIGDVIKGPMLAHKAEEEGIAVAEIIAGQSGHVNYDAIPSVIYTSPEVASVGKTEQQLIKENIKYKIGKFPFMANSRAKVINETEGFVKILAEEKTDKVLGVHIIGPHAGDMIAEMVLAMEFGASSEDIARTCHAHPTYSEAIKEAALAIDKRSIHS